MEKPTLSDYATLIITLFDEFQQTQPIELKFEKLNTFKTRELIILFVLFQFRRIFGFQTQRKWLDYHPDLVELLEFERIPDRTTLSRRYKKLEEIIQAFIFFIGQAVTDLDDAFTNDNLAEDKSLFKANGPVWHQSDRLNGVIPAKLRRLDPDATWSKSGYQGWVYGYGLHMTCTDDAFPKMAVVDTASLSDSIVIDQKADVILFDIQPNTLVADNGYTKAMRIRNWLKAGTVLITPAIKWVHGKYAEAYHAFLESDMAQRQFVKRKTSVEPLFDLIAQVIGASGLQKQLHVQKLKNVQTHLLLGVLSVQISMIMNAILGYPLRQISHIRACFT